MREDHKIFLDIIKPNSKVIDIGCGGGEFLEVLKREKKVQAYGLEIDPANVANAVSKGISAIQGDADSDLKYYPSKHETSAPFDYAILANTLQVMKNPKDILEHAARISNKVLVSIPNFGHYRNRLYLLINGKMPVTSQLSFQWYETPNIHFSTLKDFVELAEKIGCKVERKFYTTSAETTKEYKNDNLTFANILGEKGVFVISDTLSR
jgi:methionine biosynthesis protein MetW